MVHGPDVCVRYGAVGERAKKERGQLSVKSLGICLTTTGVYLPNILLRQVVLQKLLTEDQDQLCFVRRNNNLRRRT